MSQYQTLINLVSQSFIPTLLAKSLEFNGALYDFK